MLKFDNHKGQIGSDGDLSFKVCVGDTVHLTSRNKTIIIHARITDIDVTSTNYLGMITWSDVRGDDKARECATEGTKVSFTYDQILHVRHPGEDSKIKGQAKC